MPDKTYSRHYNTINLFKGAAIIYVILRQINIRVPFSGTALSGMLPQWLYKILFWSGYYGNA